MSDANKIEMANFATPGRIGKVDRVKFLAMREALLSVFPATAPGITSAEVKQQILHLLPQDLLPDGAKAG
jgi:hypothetical protein